MKGIREIIRESVREYLNENNNSKYDFNISYKDFDDLNKSIWRKLAKEDKYNQAVNYMKKYLTHNNSKLEDYQIGLIYWHIGQLYAFNNDYNNGIKYMSKKEVTDSIEPNYQQGTISFLNKDKEGLERFYNKLKTKGDPTGTGKGSGNYILKKFINNFDKSYKDVY